MIFAYKKIIPQTNNVLLAFHNINKNFYHLTKKNLMSMQLCEAPKFHYVK
jgi:hypothetical protein